MTAVIGETTPICPRTNAAYSKAIAIDPTMPVRTEIPMRSVESSPGITKSARNVMITAPEG